MPNHDANIDFPAPPPSPVSSGRRSSFANDDVLMHFLDTSLTVPDLILPDHVFPRHVSIQPPPVIDFKTLTSSENDLVIGVIRESISRTGCFQIVNYGIGKGERREGLEVSRDVFELGTNEKRQVRREVGEREFGFEEDDGREMNEEFVWGRDNERFRLDMEGVWTLGYSNFSEKMETLFDKVEKLAHEILLALENHGVITPQYQNGSKPKGSSMCYIHKQFPNIGVEDWVNSVKYDVIKMLIRGSDYYSHALGLHVCDGCSEFHVYSKKGWVSFVPDEDVLVVTVGDQIQAWSDGEYKNVVGRPICKEENREFISLAFLYSPIANNQTSIEEKKTLSLCQQAFMAVLFTFVYHFWVYIYNK